VEDPSREDGRSAALLWFDHEHAAAWSEFRAALYPAASTSLFSFYALDVMRAITVCVATTPCSGGF